MSSPRYRPKRRLRSEIFPLASILSLPVALYLAFPSGVVDFRPSRRETPESPYNALVRLDATREKRLLAAARSAWQSDSSSRRGERADLLGLGAQPEVVRIASGLKPFFSERSLPPVDYESDHIPAGLAAGAPTRLADDEEVVPPPAFPRSELLKLN